MTPLSRRRYSVYVVDDDASVLDCYRRILDRAGYDARTESDPVRLLETDPALAEADLLVLDYKMPGKNGLELLAELRRREIRARCILISAFLNEGVRQQAALLGVDRILQKPVDVATFRAAISELLPTSVPGRAEAAG